MNIENEAIDKAKKMGKPLGVTFFTSKKYRRINKGTRKGVKTEKMKTFNLTPERLEVYKRQSEERKKIRKKMSSYWERTY